MDWHVWMQSEEFFNSWRTSTEGLGAVFQHKAPKVPFVQRKGATRWMEAQEPLPGVRLITTSVPAQEPGAAAYLHMNVWLYDQPEFAGLRSRFVSGARFCWEGMALMRTLDWKNRTYMNSLPPDVHLYGINYTLRMDDRSAPGAEGLDALRQLTEAFCVYVRKVVNDEPIEQPIEQTNLQEVSPPWESEHLALSALLANLDLSESERDALVKARIGQGRFRAQLEERWKGCSVTDCRLSEVLIASHIVPWSECTNAQERWSVDNGLLLSPALDKLFDRGLISFSDTGHMLRKEPQVRPAVCDQLGVNLHGKLRGELTSATRAFLARHREKFGFGPLRHS